MKWQRNLSYTFLRQKNAVSCLMLDVLVFAKKQNTQLAGRGLR